MEKTTISMEISTTAPDEDIFLAIHLDQHEIFSGRPGCEIQTIVHQFDDIEAERCLKIIMTGKTSDRTQIKDDGSIVDDVLISVENICFDGINVDKLIWQLGEYQHDFNSNGPKTIEKFYGKMGCNGTVSLKFATPIYLWLLENM